MHRTGRRHDTPRHIIHTAQITRGVRIVAAGLLLIATLLVIGGCATSAPMTKSPTTSRPVVEGPLASVVGPAASPLAQRVSTAYDASAQQAKVTITIGAAPDVTTAQSRVMSLCFQVERALWTSNPALREVKVIVLGPIRDDYSNIIDDAYGVSDVLAPTAAKLPWNTLTPESAWIHYDATWLRASYKPNWLYGKNN
jgi:hypothetical protein